MGSQLVISSSAVLFHARLAVRNCLRSVRIKSSFFLLVYRILGSKTKNTVCRSFLSLTVEKTISYYYLLSLLIPIISYYSFVGGGFINRRWRLFCGHTEGLPQHQCQAPP